MKTAKQRFTRMVMYGVILIGLTTLVHAHAKLEKSEPAAGATMSTAPTHIQLWFNERLDAPVSKIELSSPSGKVELGPAHAMGEKSLMAGISGKVGDGTYTVAWQTAGDDGHVAKGNYTFTVKLSRSTK